MGNRERGYLSLLRDGDRGDDLHGSCRFPAVDGDLVVLHTEGPGRVEMVNLVASHERSRNVDVHCQSLQDYGPAAELHRGVPELKSKRSEGFSKDLK